MSVIYEVAKRLGCPETEVFSRAAIALGYKTHEQQAAIWLARYVQVHSIHRDVVDWCVAILMTDANERLTRHF